MIGDYLSQRQGGIVKQDPGGIMVTLQDHIVLIVRHVAVTATYHCCQQ